MNTLIRFPCPSCGKRLKAKPADVSGWGRWSCGSSVWIPDPPRPAAAPAQSPGAIVDRDRGLLRSPLRLLLHLVLVSASVSFLLGLLFLLSGHGMLGAVFLFLALSV